MSSTTNKENLLAFAFSYFMVTKPSKANDKEHFENWNAIFENFTVKGAKEYKSHLEHNFDYSGLKSEYAFDKKYSEKLAAIKDPQQKEKFKNKEEKKYKHLHTIYYQIQELYFSPFLKKGKKYRIYTQTSDFTLAIKDKCIKKLHKAFGLDGNPEILSPVDFFVINYDKKNKIINEFGNNISNSKNTLQDILVNYEKHKDKTYEHMIADYFKSGDLIGVSHKLPEGKQSNAKVNLSGNISKLRGYNRKYIDPYSEMVLALQNKTPSEIDTLINKLIDIDYGKWDLRDTKDSSTWRLFFKFNFKVVNKEFNNENFGLEVLPAGGSGSYNGKFYTKGTAKPPWVAGMAPKTVEQFIKQYPGYNTIMRMLAKRKEKCFIDAIGMSKTDINKTAKGRKAISFLNQNKFQTFAETKKNLEPFFVEISQPDLFQKYQNKLITTLKSEGGYTSDISSIKNDTIRSNHYISIQMAYFWLFGGRSMQKYLKRKIFFTVFGGITKRSFTGITGNKLINLAKTEYSNNIASKDKIELSITSAPHLTLI